MSRRNDHEKAQHAQCTDKQVAPTSNHRIRSQVGGDAAKQIQNKDILF
ncbi:hypothetical protein HY772_04945 [Candidatus Woesearchaeota archaeon]|nr:hypothetical protein [Candidatus Woesearchaeota archaeon]